jgi:hypothetical protein
LTVQDTHRPAYSLHSTGQALHSPAACVSARKHQTCSLPIVTLLDITAASAAMLIISPSDNKELGAWYPLISCTHPLLSSSSRYMAREPLRKLKRAVKKGVPLAPLTRADEPNKTRSIQQHGCRGQGTYILACEAQLMNNNGCRERARAAKLHFHRRPLYITQISNLGSLAHAR